MANPNRSSADQTASGDGGPAPATPEFLAPAAPLVEPTKADKVAQYRVAPGLSIVCQRGHLNEGVGVSERDFVGGRVDLDDLIARGAVVRS